MRTRSSGAAPCQRGAAARTARPTSPWPARPHAPREQPPPPPPSCRSLRLGDPLAALPLLHYALLKFSRHVCAHTLDCGIEVCICVWGTALRTAASLRPASAAVKALANRAPKAFQ